MEITGYIQATDSKDIIQYMKSFPEGSLFELTVHGRKEDREKPKFITVYRDGNILYEFDFAKRSFKRYRKTYTEEFYVTEKEAWYLYEYLKAFGSEVEPPFWRDARNNIRRRNNPLSDLTPDCTVHVKD